MVFKMCFQLLSVFMSVTDGLYLSLGSIFDNFVDNDTHLIKHSS